MINYMDTNLFQLGTCSVDGCGHVGRRYIACLYNANHRCEHRCEHPCEHPCGHWHGMSDRAPPFLCVSFQEKSAFIFFRTFLYETVLPICCGMARQE